MQLPISVKNNVLQAQSARCTCGCKPKQNYAMGGIPKKYQTKASLNSGKMLYRIIDRN